MRRLIGRRSEVNSPEPAAAEAPASPATAAPDIAVVEASYREVGDRDALLTVQIRSLESCASDLALVAGDEALRPLASGHALDRTYASFLVAADDARRPGWSARLIVDGSNPVELPGRLARRAGAQGPGEAAAWEWSAAESGALVETLTERLTTAERALAETRELQAADPDYGRKLAQAWRESSDLRHLLEAREATVASAKREVAAALASLAEREAGLSALEERTALVAASADAVRERNAAEAADARQAQARAEDELAAAKAQIARLQERAEASEEIGADLREQVRVLQRRLADQGGWRVRRRRARAEAPSVEGRLAAQERVHRAEVARLESVIAALRADGQPDEDAPAERVRREQDESLRDAVESIGINFGDVFGGAAQAASAS